MVYEVGKYLVCNSYMGVANPSFCVHTKMFNSISRLSTAMNGFAWYEWQRVGVETCVGWPRGRCWERGDHKDWVAMHQQLHTIHLCWDTKYGG
jgi:hypothetical protein